MMGRGENLLESSLKLISCFIICVNSELREWQLFLFFVILSEKLENFCVLSFEITKILESDVNRTSQFRTEVNHDSLKCKNCFRVWIFREHEFTNLSQTSDKMYMSDVNCLWDLY